MSWDALIAFFIGISYGYLVAWIKYFFLKDDD